MEIGLEKELELIRRRLDSIEEALSEERPLEDRRAFSISLEKFLQMRPEQTRALHARVGVAYRALLDDAWQRDMQQVVICDGEIAYETKSDGIISKIVQQIATERDKPCYTFSAPDVAEESGWNQVKEDDYYPTIDVSLGPVGPEEYPDMRGFISVKADFDTGNQATKLFSADQVGVLLGPYTLLDWELASGPFGDYRYIQKDARLCILDESGTNHSLSCTVKLVEDWNRSNVRRWSPNRMAWIGRDIIRKFGVKVELNPAERTTRVYPASA